MKTYLKSQYIKKFKAKTNSIYTKLKEILGKR